MGQTMREKFRQHHKLNEDERSTLWETCAFVFDTNVLLNIYRYADSTREDLFEVLGALRQRVWIPHRVAFEFYRRRLDVIQAQRAKYQELLTTLEATITGLRDGSFRKSAFLKLDELENLVRPGIDEAKRLLQEQREKHPNLIHEDPYLESLVEIIGTAIGEEYSPERLDQLYQEAEARINDQIPPGYRDVKKPVPDRYGDILIWFQLLDFAVDAKKPVVFVTDDDKEDWWQIVSGQKLGPRPELREEMRRKAGVEFYLYKPAYLLEIAGQELKLEVAKSSIDDAKQTGAELQMGEQKLSNMNLILHADTFSRGSRREAGNWQQRRALVERAEQAVLEWLRDSNGSGEVEQPGRGPLSFISHFSDGRIGFSVRYVSAQSRLLGSVGIRLQEASLRAYHQISEGQIDTFYHVLVFEDLQEIENAAERLVRVNRSEPAYPIILGYVDEHGKFRNEKFVSAMDRSR